MVVITAFDFTLRVHVSSSVYLLLTYDHEYFILNNRMLDSC